MRTVKWNAFLSGLCGFAVVLGVVAVNAHADVTIEKGASILVFPKVLNNNVFDTVIQITNTGNSMVHAKCFYVNATLRSTLTGLDCHVPSATCVPIWQETDFTIWLTKQQPTHWLTSKGRRVDPTDGFQNDGSGFDPGRVPPMPSPFEGELKCIEVADSDEPVTGNHLKGEANLKVVANTTGTGIDDPGTVTGDISKYNAIGILGDPSVAPENPLLLDGVVYDACPEKLIVNHLSTGSPDKVAGPLFATDPTFTSTELTLVPCSEDFETQTGTSVTVQFLLFNEFEQRFSASTTVSCYLNVELTKIDSPTAPNRSVFSWAVLGTTAGHMEITPVPNNGAVIGVTERIVSLSNTVAARAAYNIHTEGSLVPASGPDKVVLTAATP